MVIGQILNYGIRLGARHLKQLHRLDVSIHKGLYGASAGRGVRHGRDAGIFVSQYRQGDDLDPAVPQEPRNGFTSSKDTKAYRGRFRTNNRRNKQYCRPRRYRSKSSQYNY